MITTALFAPSLLTPRVPRRTQIVASASEQRVAIVTGASRGIGRGIAIPHGKHDRLNGLVGVFARIDKSIDFDAVDGEPVDLLFLLLAPPSAGADHLKALAKVSRTLRDQTICTQLRGCEDADGIYALLSGTSTSNAA